MCFLIKIVFHNDLIAAFWVERVLIGYKKTDCVLIPT